MWRGCRRAVGWATRLITSQPAYILLHRAGKHTAEARATVQCSVCDASILQDRHSTPFFQIVQTTYRTAQTISAKVGWIWRKLAIIQTLQNVCSIRVSRSHVRIHGLLDVSECNVIVLFKQLTKLPPNVSLIASINVTVVVKTKRADHGVNRIIRCGDIAIWIFQDSAAILDLVKTEIAPFDPPTPKTPTLNPNIKWIGWPIVEISPFELFPMRGWSSIGCQYAVYTYTDVI